MKNYVDIIGLIASLIGILNVLLALPNFFKDVNSNFLVYITEQNFALKLGITFVLQVAIGYVVSISIAAASRSEKNFSIMSIGLIVILLSSWLTFFNISQILYTNKLSTTSQYIWMLVFLIISILLQGLQILSSKWDNGIMNLREITWENYLLIKTENTQLKGKLFFIGVLAFFIILYFVVYCLN